MVKLMDLKVGDCFMFPRGILNGHIYVVKERKESWIIISYMCLQTNVYYSSIGIGPHIIYDQVSKLNTSIVKILYA